MSDTQLEEFGARYTQAWCSQDAASVASFYAENGSLKINDDPAAVGRKAIAALAQEFMTDFPDLLVKMIGITLAGNEGVYRWSMTGTNTGPGGTGKPVSIRGYEAFTLDADGRIVECTGHFDEEEYRRQLAADPDGRLRE